MKRHVPTSVEHEYSHYVNNTLHLKVYSTSISNQLHKVIKLFSRK
jgi:hypothetical protein